MTAGPVTRWGVLGTAKIATKVGKAITRARGAELVAVASRDGVKAAAWAQENGASIAYGSYRELVNSPEVDAIYIPLPNSMHAEWTIRAAEAGKHVLCEKPLGMNQIEATQMREACLRAGVQFMDGVMWVHHERTAAMARVIDEGQLGTLRRVTSAFTFNGRDMLPENIRFARELGGGSLGDLGWYCIRATWFAFRELPKRVMATGRFDNNVDMSLSALMWYEGDRIASFDCGFETVKRNWMEVAGTEASLVCDDFVQPESESESRFFIHGDRNKRSQQTFGPCIQEVAMIENFCNAIRVGRLRSDWADVPVATQIVVDALDESARKGGVVMDVRVW